MPRILMFVLCQLVAAQAGAEIKSLSNPDHLTAADILLFDASALSKCRESSVAGAYCLPAGTFIAGDDSVASFYHIDWALGTHGLTSNETLLIFADDSGAASLLAGILYLAGQRQVWIWRGDVAQLQVRFGEAPGRLRGITRQRVYHGILREDHLALIPEIERLEGKGWRIYRASDKSSSEDRLIVAGPIPAESIIAFVELMGEHKTALKLVIDPYSEARGNAGMAYSMVGLVLIFVAFGAISMWLKNRWNKNETSLRHR